MLSLAYHCTAYINPSSTFTLTLLARCFSLTHRRPGASSAPSPVKPVKDAKTYRNSNEARRLRYATDPEYRAKIVAQNLARYHRLARDPEFRARHTARCLACQTARYKADSEYRAKRVAGSSVYKKARRAVDPAFYARHEKARYRSESQVRERILARAAQWRSERDAAARHKARQRAEMINKQRYADDFFFKQRKGLQDWARSIPTRELIWKTHDAESHADPIANFCSGQNCGFEKKLKLWMKRKGSGFALYNCFQCFTSEWVPYKVLPIGYEHVVSGSGERIEPRPVPTDALRVKASESTKAPNVVGRASSAKKKP
jgi:hypothetical protein